MAVIRSGKKATFLKFDNIDRTDAGQYTCRANNSVEVTSIDTSIVVLCKYILTLFPNRKLRIGKILSAEKLQFSLLIAEIS